MTGYAESHRNSVQRGDCIVELQKLDDKCADLILIDPPYNIGKDEWDDFGITRKGYQPKPYSGESIMIGWKKFSSS